MSFTKVGRFSTIISLIIFLVPHLPLLLLPWLYGSFIIDPQVPESLFIIFQSILCSSDCLQVQWFYLLSSLIYCCTIQWGFKFWMLYFSVLQFSFDPFFIMFFFAETFFMCFQVICNLLLKCFYASSVQFSHSLVSDSLWPPWTAARQASLSITKSWSLLKLMSIESVMPSNHLILRHPFLLPPSIFPSIGSFQMSQFFASGGQSIKSFSFSIFPFNDYSGLISFCMDWLDLLAVKGTHKILLQHHGLKASILWCSTFLYSPTLTTIYDYLKNHSLD